MSRRSRRQHEVATRYGDLVEQIYELESGGRHVVDFFLEIPSAEVAPDYREVIQVPISMAEISKRARLNTYDEDDEILQDIELMLDNARTYNGDDSVIVDDALTIFDFVLEALGRPVCSLSRLKQQQKIVHDLITYKYKGRRLSGAFLNEPNREEYPQYYETIKEPTSLKTIESELDDMTDGETWDAFSSRVNKLFENAFSYNDEGSQIHEDAVNLKRYFVNKVARITETEDELRSGGKQGSRDGGNKDSESSNEEEEEEVIENRFEDDDDDDFEADPDDDEDEEDDDEEEEELDDEMDIDDKEESSRLKNMVFYNEIVHREEGSSAAQGMIQLVTFSSPDVEPYLQQQNIKPKVQVPAPYLKDLVQVRVPAPETRVFSSFAMSLANHHHTLDLFVYLNDSLSEVAHQLTVLHNGKRLTPTGQDAGGSISREKFDLRLLPGLNDVTIVVIGPDEAGTVRPVANPPVVGTDMDEERMTLWLNLTR